MMHNQTINTNLRVKEDMIDGMNVLIVSLNFKTPYMQTLVKQYEVYGWMI